MAATKNGPKRSMFQASAKVGSRPSTTARLARTMPYSRAKPTSAAMPHEHHRRG